jgi:hypothetical protein
MFARAVTLAAVVIVWLTTQSIAQAAPTPSGESIVVLNRQLQSMVVPSNVPRTINPVIPFHPRLLDGFSSRAATGKPKSDWLSSPTFLLIAAHLTSAERILHYRRAGFDANFWGVLSTGRSIKIKFFVRL